MRFFVKTLILSLVLCASTAWAEPLRVVASFSIMGDMVKNVGGEDVVVTTLVGPDGDAHVYEPTPTDAKAVSNAQLLVVNGLHFEGWMDRLVQSAGYRGEIVVVSQGVTPRQMKEEHEDAAHGEQHHDPHHHGTIDPHAWQDLANGVIYVDNLIAALVKVDPDHAEAYRRRGAAYRAQLQDTDRWVRAQIATVPAAQRRVITSHDAFGYFSAAYGVEFLAPVGWNTENEPSAKDVARLIRQIKQEKTRALFVENMSDPRLIKRIAREAGGVVGGTLYSDALAPAGQTGDSYIGMFRHNVPALTAAMAQN
ncbi:MAG TPA: metal ABC transporter substrate-binding protein [Candidatus Competibacteraceae bacterium]|nr:metal ABC transporter substrate-binding protein [Candidatus Competibacteraceae bacterium]HQD55031.1 metal ABC transporter substrate-binding protein [Candidatus Competibacteraceae bacterium]